METYLLKFLESDLGIIDFCKVNNLNRVKFEDFLKDNGYLWKKGRNGKKVKLMFDAVQKYLSSSVSHTIIAKEFGITG